MVLDRAFLRSDGLRIRLGNSKIRRKVDEILEHPDGANAELLDSLGLCERSIELCAEEFTSSMAVAAG